MEVDSSQGVDLPTLQERFSREITTLYLRVADSACQQSNYAVATRYLKLTESAIKEVDKVINMEDRAFILHSLHFSLPFFLSRFLPPALSLRCRATTAMATQCGRDESAASGTGPFPHQNRATHQSRGQN